MNFLHSEIGSAKDNAKSSVHNWYKFTAGFSYKFVDAIIELENVKPNSELNIFDPFAGCGTTLVSAQKKGIPAIGNEGQEFMYEIIQAKLNWNLDSEKINQIAKSIKQFVTTERKSVAIGSTAHPLLLSLYTKETLKTLYLIKIYIEKITSIKYKRFFKLALSQTLHKTSIHPIAVPYIVRNKTIKTKTSVWKFFLATIKNMLKDCEDLKTIASNSKIYLQDSRTRNPKIKAKSCSLCITSPPYLNNLDYGEVSKVHTHFFGITHNWKDITDNVRKKLVTGSTTHYSESEFKIHNYKRTSFYKKNKLLVDKLVKQHDKLKNICNSRLGKKSFHILMLLYFKDMYAVLKEIRRVLKENRKAYIILGDSAPYGIHIATTRIIGQIALSTGFKKYKIIKIRNRGTKWKDLKYRHNKKLTENVLVLN